MATMSDTLCKAVCTPLNTKRPTTTILIVVALFLASISQASTPDFSRYDAILTKHPFGPPPPEPNTNVVDLIENIEVEEEIYAIPPGLDKIKVTLLSRFKGIPAAGFVDGESNKPYYLLEGQEFDGFKLIAVDLKKATIKLRAGTYEAELPLWINPGTTNQADVATFGMPPGSLPETLVAVATPVRLAPPSRRLTTEEQKRIDELQQRREDARKKRDEERKAQAEELAKLTPKEREQRLHDINTDIIINNSGPPLPIELNQRDMEKLSEAGFDVPGVDKK